MKPLAAIASAVLALAVVASAPSSASAQRGGGARGGSSARSAPSFHSSFSSSARSFSGSAYRYSDPAFATAPRITSAPRFTVTPSAGRPAFYSSRRPPGVDRRRYAYAPGIGYAYPFAYPDYGWLDPGYAAPYTDAPPYDDASAQPIYPDPNQYQQQAEPAPPPLADTPRYTSVPQPPPPEEAAVTLVFKDGRPSEQIHNYVLTRTMLYVRDQHRRDIPVDQLDLAATEKANQSNGVEFALPASN
jgi:hypothetical protein